MFIQTIETKGDFDFKAASQAKVSNYKKQKGQTCMPKGTATYWKHDENQDDGDDVTMTIYEFLVDYVTDDLYISEIVI